jgi:transposase-like protein
LDVNDSDVIGWVYRYRENGELAFLNTGKNNVYSPELKLKAVCSYLRGEGSLRAVAAMFGLRSSEQLRKWTEMYNNGEDFSHKMSGGSRMKTSRNTTKEERIQIVKECIANGCNYGESAIKHNVSYQQVYGWVKRYKKLGEAGLEDRRGRRKANQEPRSEIEKLQIENERLKHELYMAKMERDLLKKVKELERKDLYRK